MLQKTKTTREIYEYTIIFGLRRNKNLSDHPVRASTKTNLQRNHPSLCRYCPKINRTGQITPKKNCTTFTSMVNTNCQNSNIIDLISCNTCGIQYVRQTKKRLIMRFQGHYYDIKNHNDTSVSRHFNKCPSSQPACFDGGTNREGQGRKTLDTLPGHSSTKGS